MEWLKSDARQTRLCLGLLCIVILIPLALVPIPPLLDYPNHLVRLWLLSGGADIPTLHQFYLTDWHGIATNIGIDLAAAAFGHLIDPFLLGRILLALAIILPPLGAVFLHRALFRKWHPWQILFLFFWCMKTLLYGFLNFQIGFGLALFAAAADISMGKFPVWPRFACRLFSGFVLIIFHPFALFFYGALLAGLNFGPAPMTRAETPPRLRRAILSALVILIPVFCVIYISGEIPGVSRHAALTITHKDLHDTLMVLQSPFISYNLLIDVCLEIVFLFFCFRILSREKNEIHYGMLAATGIVAVLACAMPNQVGHMECLHERLPPMALFMAMLSVCPGNSTKTPARKIYTVVAAGLVLLRTGYILWNWQAATPMLTSMRRVLSVVPAGTRVLPVCHIQPFHTFSRAGYMIHVSESYRHFPALVIPWRHAFEPMLFALKAVQPIHVTQAYESSATPIGGILPSVQALNNPKLRPPHDRFLKDWQQKFDYVLVLNADQPESEMTVGLPKTLHLIKNSGFARIYKITRP